jgi:hypothetical protein
MASSATDFMKPSSWDKQLWSASPREDSASPSDQTNHPSKNEVRTEVGLDVSHHARISQRGGEMLFYLTSFFTARHSRNQTLSYAFKLSAVSNQL